MRTRPKTKRPCSVEGCERPHNSHGYCAMHGLRLERFGDVHREGKWVFSKTGFCEIEGCSKKHASKGMCQMHYARVMRTGSPYLPERLTCVRCSTIFARPYKGDPAQVRFCSHECRYADQLDRQKANSDVRAARHREWRAKNPHLVLAASAKRASLKRRAESRIVTGDDLVRLIARHGGMCAYCHVAPFAHLDHVVPIVRGGRHAIGNLLPACADCNLTKGQKLLAEWRFLRPLPRRFRRYGRKPTVCTTKPLAPALPSGPDEE